MGPVVVPTEIVELAYRVIDAVVTGHSPVSVIPANAAFTNSVQVLDTLSPSGSRLRFVVNRSLAILGDFVVPVERAHTDYYEFAHDAVRRAYARR